MPVDQSGKDYPVRLPGHTLRSEGAAYTVPGCTGSGCGEARNDRPVRNQWLGGSGGHGHALCECGATSRHLTSASQRKTWHREHKADVADAHARED